MELSNWNWLYNATDKLTKGWLKHGAKLLQQVTASAKASNEGSADDMQRFPSTASSSSSWQSVCGDAFGHTMMDQQLTRLMSNTSGSGMLVCTHCHVSAGALLRLSVKASSLALVISSQPWAALPPPPHPYSHETTLPVPSCSEPMQ